MINAAQIRMARAALRWKVAELTEKAGVAPNTVVRAEAAGSINRSTLAVIQNALEDAGVVFIDIGGRPGVLAPAE